MSSPHYDWWVNATRMIRNFPARKQEHDDLLAPTVTANLSGMPGGGEAHRTTEDVALRQMAPAKQQEYDAVSRAINITEQMPNGLQRLELIRLIYWTGTKRTIVKASSKVHIAEATAWRWHSAFVKLVGEMYGYLI